MPVPVPAGKPFPRTREEREQYWHQFGRRNDELSSRVPPGDKVAAERVRKQLEKEFPPYGILLLLYGNAYTRQPGLFGPPREQKQSHSNQEGRKDRGR